MLHRTHPHALPATHDPWRQDVLEPCSQAAQQALQGAAGMKPGGGAGPGGCCLQICLACEAQPDGRAPGKAGSCRPAKGPALTSEHGCPHRRPASGAKKRGRPGLIRSNSRWRGHAQAGGQGGTARAGSDRGARLLHTSLAPRPRTCWPLCRPPPPLCRRSMLAPAAAAATAAAACSSAEARRCCCSLTACLGCLAARFCCLSSRSGSWEASTSSLSREPARVLRACSPAACPPLLGRDGGDAGSPRLPRLVAGRSSGGWGAPRLFLGEPRVMGPEAWSPVPVQSSPIGLSPPKASLSSHAGRKFLPGAAAHTAPPGLRFCAHTPWQRQIVS